MTMDAGINKKKKIYIYNLINFSISLSNQVIGVET